MCVLLKCVHHQLHQNFNASFVLVNTLDLWIWAHQGKGLSPALCTACLSRLLSKCLLKLKTSSGRLNSFRQTSSM